MLVKTSNEFVQKYIENIAIEMQSDLLEVIDIMAAISPNAELIGDLGIPYFQQGSTLLYGVAAREDHLYVYFFDSNLLHDFAYRLRPAQFGNNCLIIHRLSDININVFVELISQMRVHFDRSN